MQPENAPPLILQRYLNAEIAEAAEGGLSNNGKAISASGSQSMLFARLPSVALAKEGSPIFAAVARGFIPRALLRGAKAPRYSFSL